MNASYRDRWRLAGGGAGAPGGSWRDSTTMSSRVETLNLMDCGGKRSATPLSESVTAFQSGVAAALCHRSPQGSDSWRGRTPVRSRVVTMNASYRDRWYSQWFMERQHLPASDVSWSYGPGGARAARVPAGLERRKEASETSEGCREMCELHVPRLNGAEPATQRRPHRFMGNPLFQSNLLTSFSELQSSTTKDTKITKGFEVACSGCSAWVSWPIRPTDSTTDTLETRKPD